MAETETRILGPDGRPLRLPATVLQAPPDTSGGARTVMSYVDMDTLSPRQIRAMLLAAESGDLSNQAALFERMEEKDGELDAHLRTRKSAVASLPWEIQAADDSPEAVRAAGYARAVVARIPELNQAIVDLLDAVPKGFAAAEIDWRTGADEWRPARLLYRPQRWFEAAEDGTTLRLKQPWGSAAAEFNPTNWIVHRAQARSGFLGRTSLLRSCVRAFIVRHISWKDWMSFAEVYGMPLRIGRLREGVPWDSEEAKQLWAAVRALGMDAAAVVREGNEITTAETKAGTGAIFERILACGSREMVLAILGQTLTSGGEQGGSYALGKVHQMVRQDLRDGDAAALGQTLSDQLLAPIVLLNIGQAPLPRWAFTIQDPVDLADLATTLKTLGEASPGFKVPARWLYAKFNIPRPDKGEETVELGAAATTLMSSAPMPKRPRGRSDLLWDPTFIREARTLGCSQNKLWAHLNQAEPAWRMLDKLALQWLGEKRIATEAAWKALSPAGRQRAWFVTGLQRQPTAIVAGNLRDVLQEGQTENELLDRLEKAGISVPEGVEPGPGQIPAWQARLVHRNNRWGAQNAGQYLRLQRDRDVRPYGQWMCHSPCPICQPLCGNVAPLDGEFFAKNWPEIHHGCQCEVVSVSAAEVEQDEDLRARLDQRDPDPLDAPPDFQYHPGDAYYIEAEGGEPATDAGRKDLDILSRLATIATFL